VTHLGRWFDIKQKTRRSNTKLVIIAFLLSDTKKNENEMRIIYLRKKQCK